MPSAISVERLRTVTPEAVTVGAALLILAVGLVLLGIAGGLGGGLASQFALPFTIEVLAGLAICLPLLAGNIDLSVGGVISATSVIAAVVTAEAGPLAGLAAGLAFGGAIGAINGALVAFQGVPSVIVTLGADVILLGSATGLQELLTGSTQSVVVDDEFLLALGEDEGLYVTLLIGLVVLVHLATIRTRWGVRLRASGANYDAASGSGIRASRYVFSSFVFSGAIAACAALLITANSGSSVPSAGEGMELAALVVAVIAGFSLVGGRGMPLALLAGGAVIVVLELALQELELEAYVQYMVRGGVLIAILAAHSLLLPESPSRARHPE